MTIKEYTAEKFAEVLPQIEVETVREMLEIPPDKKMGDYAFPCFRLAKQLRKAPVLISKEIAEALQEKDAFEKAEAVGPYVNVCVRAEKVVDLVTEAFGQQERFGSSEEGKGKTIVLDYSSINIAKPFHIGHLRTTVIGNSIHKLYRYLGYNTVRVNHLGDWGTQFGKLVVAYRMWGNKELVEQQGIQGLLDLYVRFHQEAKIHPELDDEA